MRFSLVTVLVVSAFSCLFLLPLSQTLGLSGFTKCHPTDNDCIVKSANEVLHNHPYGLPEIFLDAVEPYMIDDIVIKGDPSSPVNFNLEMRNLTFNGFSTLTFTKFSGFKEDPHGIQLDIDSVNDHVEMVGKYKVSGKMLVFPITGEGDVLIKIDGLYIKARLKPTVEVRDGVDYLKMDYFKMKVKADHMSISMTNLFNGQKTLAENMNQVLNENWKLLWDEIEPVFSEQITKACFTTFSKVLKDIPYKDFFDFEKKN